MGLTAYDIVYTMTSGGPGTATSVISYFTWSISFTQLNIGEGAALATMMALVSIVFIAGCSGRYRRARSMTSTSVQRNFGLRTLRVDRPLMVFVLTPLLVTLLASITPDKAIISQPAHWFTSGFNVDNYAYILTGMLPSQYTAEAGQRTWAWLARRSVTCPPRCCTASWSPSVMAIDLVLGAPPPMLW